MGRVGLGQGIWTHDHLCRSTTICWMRLAVTIPLSAAVAETLLKNTYETFFSVSVTVHAYFYA